MNWILLAVGLSTPVAYADPDNYHALLNKIDQLRRELDEVKHALSSQQNSRADSLIEVDTDLSEDYLLPYMSIGSFYHNEVLLLNDTPDVNKDLALLKQKQIQEFDKKFILSGNIAIDASWHSNGFGKSQDITSDIGAKVDIDIGAFINPYMMGYAQYSASSSNIFLDQAFINVGNLDESPFYLTLGRIYLPSGNFGSVLVSSSLVRRLTRIRANAVSAGYAGNGVYMALYGFDGPASRKGNTKIDQWGVNLQIDNDVLPNDYIRWVVGASYVNNIASAHDFPQDGFDDHLRDHVGYYNLRGGIGIGDLQAQIEYVSAVKSFNNNVGGLQFNGHGALPKAIVYQLSYIFENSLIGNGPASFGISYSTTQQALWKNGLPRKQYGMAYKAEITEFVGFGIEYLRLLDYAKNTTGGIFNQEVFGSGKQDNQVLTKLDLYF